MEFKDEVIQLLLQLHMADPLIELETSSAGKVGGYIISKTFEGMDHLRTAGPYLGPP